MIPGDNDSIPDMAGHYLRNYYYWGKFAKRAQKRNDQTKPMGLTQCKIQRFEDFLRNSQQEIWKICFKNTLVTGNRQGPKLQCEIRYLAAQQWGGHLASWRTFLRHGL